MDRENPSIILDAKGVDDAVFRIAQEITQRHSDLEKVALVGIHTRGVHLAKRIRDAVEKISAKALRTGEIDITLYRDDWTKIGYSPVVQSTKIDFPVDDMIIILVDDVLFTGRTTRAALDELIDFGRPAKVELAVLVDRGMRELPIQADYVGVFEITDRHHMVNVMLTECDGKDLVVLSKNGD